MREIPLHINFLRHITEVPQWTRLNFHLATERSSNPRNYQPNPAASDEGFEFFDGFSWTTSCAALDLFV